MGYKVVRVFLVLVIILTFVWHGTAGLQTVQAAEYERGEIGEAAGWYFYRNRDVSFAPCKIDQRKMLNLGAEDECCQLYIRGMRTCMVKVQSKNTNGILYDCRGKQIRPLGSISKNGQNTWVQWYALKPGNYILHMRSWDWELPMKKVIDVRKEDVVLGFLDWIYGELFIMEQAFAEREFLV